MPEVLAEVFAEVLAESIPNILYESHIDSHIIAMLVVAFRSTALAVEHEAPVREGVLGETVGFPNAYTSPPGKTSRQYK